MGEEVLRRTPLYNAHRRLGARLVPFAGWDMPVQYAGILDETRAVRTGAGLFDISHMGRVYVSGDGALGLIQSVTTNDAAALQPGQAQYSLIPNEAGGIVDDIIVYRLAADRFLVVFNAGNTAKDLAWFRAHAGAGVTIDDRTEQTAMVAVQGPEAPRIVAALAGAAVLSIDRFAYTEGTICGTPVTLCRTGYTGEDGFEIVAPAERAEALWDALVSAGAAPCGLGARDLLRIEAGYPLYGHEIDDDTSPVAAGLMWAVKLDKGDFVGRERIADMRRSGAGRRLVGLTLASRIVPRQGYTVLAEGQPVGHITSGAFSPTAGHSIAMAYLDSARARTGAEVCVEVRGQMHAARVVPKKNLIGC